LVQRRSKQRLKVALYEFQSRGELEKILLSLGLQRVGPQRRDAVCSTERGLPDLLTMVASCVEDLLDAAELLQSPCRVGKQVVNQTRRDAILVEVPLILTLSREHPRWLNATQGTVLPVARVRDELRHSANRRPARTRDWHSFLLHPQVESRPLTYVLEVLECLNDCKIERKRAGALGELLCHGRSAGVAIPDRVLADRLHHTDHSMGL
jgi:hypothetical protein